MLSKIPVFNNYIQLVFWMGKVLRFGLELRFVLRLWSDSVIYSNIARVTSLHIITEIFAIFR